MITFEVFTDKDAQNIMTQVSKVFNKAKIFSMNIGGKICVVFNPDVYSGYTPEQLKVIQQLQIISRNQCL